MEIVSLTEFRNNIKKYLDIARDEELVIHRGKNESFVVTPLNKMDKKISLLSPEQKTAIDEALEEVSNGNVHSHQYVMEETKKRFPHLSRIMRQDTDTTDLLSQKHGLKRISLNM